MLTYHKKKREKEKEEKTKEKIVQKKGKFKKKIRKVQNSLFEKDFGKTAHNS